jgi:hypothetical protein
MALASILHGEMTSMAVVIFYLMLEKDSWKKVVLENNIYLPIEEKQIKE